MIQILLIIFCTILLLNCCVFTVHAEDFTSVYEETGRQLDDLLADFDVGFTSTELESFSIGDFWDLLCGTVSAHIHAPLRLLGAIFLVIAAISLLNTLVGDGLSGEFRGLNSLVATLTSMAVITPIVTEMYNNTLMTLRIAGNYILVFVPVFCSFSVICGNVTSAGFFHFAILTASELLVRLADSFLLPLLCLCTYLGISGSIFGGKNLSYISDLLQKAINRVISVTAMLFAGFVTMKCNVAAKADGLGAKAVKSAISGFVPIVGGAVSDAYGTVKGSFELLHGTVGMVGVIALTIIIVPKVVELLIFRAVLNIGIAAAGLFSAEPVAGLLKCFDNGLSVALCVLVCHSLTFVVCTGMIIQTL